MIVFCWHAQHVTLDTGDTSDIKAQPDKITCHTQGTTHLKHHRKAYSMLRSRQAHRGVQCMNRPGFVRCPDSVGTMGLSVMNCRAACSVD